jgi:LysR family hca operon transcriptional activator
MWPKPMSAAAQFAGGLFRTEKSMQAFLHRANGVPGLAFCFLVKEPLMVILPSDHPLTALQAISPRDIAEELFVIVPDTAALLSAVIDDYLKRSGIDITSAHEADNVTMGISLIAFACNCRIIISITLR